MDITKYISTLPDEVLGLGTFCVTRKGEKQPYDPIKGFSISAKDDFYDIFTLAELDLDRYDTLGIKIIDPISTIDIDDCIDSNGVISEHALDIINIVKSYTEISPSGTGIRILFKATNEFVRELYKIKNSKNGVEYYDGKDQLTKGGRMVRLSANRIFNQYEYREADTSKVLDKYMAKDIDLVNSSNVAEEINEDKCFFIGQILRLDSLIYDVYYRHMTILSESEWDLILANHINNYTSNTNELRKIFEESYYFTKKKNIEPKFHRNKWFNTTYGENIIQKARPTGANPMIAHYASMFDTYENNNCPMNIEQVAKLAINMGFIKESYVRGLDLDNVILFEGEDLISQLMWIANNRKNFALRFSKLVKEHLKEIKNV